MTTDQRYLEISLRIPSSHHEILIAELLDLGFDGFEQNEDHLLAYIPLDRYSEPSKAFIASWLSEQTVSATYMSEHIFEPQNWNEAWEQSIEPMEVGEFYIRPTWKPVPTPPGLHLLEIDPKMAFGTGYHETTRLMLRMLPGCVNSGETVLDVGTGTGVLAIAALKLGAAHAFGFDIDEWSYINATENALLNKVENQFHVAEGSFEVIPTIEGYNLVLANVNRNMLLSTSKQITEQVRSGGLLVLSGLLDVDEDAIRGNEDYADLKLLDRMQENEWICLKFHKP
jgi:ribosomal protein L11 methyltransferase